MFNNKAKHRSAKYFTVVIVALAFMFAASDLTIYTKSKTPKKRTHIIEIRRSLFTPKTLRVNVGDTVIWKNRDIVPHTATGKGFDSGYLKTGASWKFVIRKKRNYSYICTYHPTMKGTIIVR